MRRVALIVGSGISAELVPSVLEIIEAAGVAIDWLRVDVPRLDPDDMKGPLAEAVEAVESCGVGLKTRLFAASSIGSPEGSRNPNVLLRRRLGLYAGLFSIRPIEGIPTRYPGIDLLLVRENTEDIYKGIEHEIVDGVVESLKVVTREASERIARFAFDAVESLGRRHVTFIHKANIMKMSDGLFLDATRGVAAQHPEVGYREMIVDAACMQMVLDPYQFDVLLAGNLYGDILSNVGSGLAGGVSSVSSVSIGDRTRVYEAIHGHAPDLEGTGLANPLPILTPALGLLRHLGEESAAERVEDAVRDQLLSDSDRTPDLGGEASTREMVDGILNSLENPS